MLFGVVVFGYKLGSNPFVLLREHAEFINLPFVKSPTYLNSLGWTRLKSFITKIIDDHSSTNLISWFCSNTGPFAYAFADLSDQNIPNGLSLLYPGPLNNDFGCWNFNGGAWAYESLSFGCFWAWDPVENKPSALVNFSREQGI